MTSSINNPDFEPAFLIRKSTKDELKKDGLIQIQPKKNTGKNIQTKNDIDLRKIDKEEIKLAKVTHEMSIAIQQARAAMKLTQEKLSQQCGFSKDVIANYENGKAIVKQHELEKINRVLKIKLKKPKIEKIVTMDKKEEKEKKTT